jgi:hypothetical protein
MSIMADLSLTMIPSVTLPIMNPVEPFIDTVATELNNLLSAATPGLEALDVDIQTTSPSVRDYTIWTGTFIKHWPGPTESEQASVTINLNCMLPLKPTEVEDVEADCHTIAEIFQIGKISRVRAIQRWQVSFTAIAVVGNWKHSPRKD